MFSYLRWGDAVCSASTNLHTKERALKATSLAAPVVAILLLGLTSACTDGPKRDVHRRNEKMKPRAPNRQPVPERTYEDWLSTRSKAKLYRSAPLDGVVYEPMVNVPRVGRSYQVGDMIQDPASGDRVRFPYSYGASNRSFSFSNGREKKMILSGTYEQLRFNKGRTIVFEIRSLNVAGDASTEITRLAPMLAAKQRAGATYMRARDPRFPASVASEFIVADVRAYITPAELVEQYR